MTIIAFEKVLQHILRSIGNYWKTY